MYYVECSLEIIQNFGYSHQAYYTALESMFYNALEGIAKIGAEKKYESRINSISETASEYGMELFY